MNRQEAVPQSQPAYVVDTHVIYWYLRHPERLSVAAEAIFRLAETGNALIVVPAIAIAELYFLSVKVGQPFVVADIFELLDGVAGIRVSDLGRDQLSRLDCVTDVAEIHDRLIAAEALALNSPVVTRDESLARSKHVLTVW